MLGQNCWLQIGSQSNPSQIDFNIPGGSAGASGVARQGRIYQTDDRNGDYARIDFWSNNYASKDSIIPVPESDPGYNAGLPVLSAFNVANVEEVLFVNGM